MYLPKPVKTKYHIKRGTFFLFLLILTAVALGIREYYEVQAESPENDTNK